MFVVLPFNTTWRICSLSDVNNKDGSKPNRRNGMSLASIPAPHYLFARRHKYKAGFELKMGLKSLNESRALLKWPRQCIFFGLVVVVS